MNSNTIASMLSGGPTDSTTKGPEGVVEIGLLLPTKRAAALLRLAQDRRESVGQVLRRLIDRELAELA
jgi:hypothetical protein